MSEEKILELRSEFINQVVLYNLSRGFLPLMLIVATVDAYQKAQETYFTNIMLNIGQGLTFGLAIYALCIIGFYFVFLKEYLTTTYSITNETLPFKNGYSKNFIKIKDIKKIELKQNFMQKKYRVGTIRILVYPLWMHILFTAGRTIRIMGHEIYDVKNPEIIYAQLKELIDKQKLTP